MRCPEISQRRTACKNEHTAQHGGSSSSSGRSRQPETLEKRTIVGAAQQNDLAVDLADGAAAEAGVRHKEGLQLPCTRTHRATNDGTYSGCKQIVGRSQAGTKLDLDASCPARECAGELSASSCATSTRRAASPWQQTTAATSRVIASMHRHMRWNARGANICPLQDQQVQEQLAGKSACLWRRTTAAASRPLRR